MRFWDERLQQLRFHADPLTDQVIAALNQQSGTHAVCTLLRSLAPGAKSPAPPLPALIENWLTDHAKLPAGVDWERIDRPSAFYLSSGFSIFLILGSASLIECYAAARGVKALTYSNRLGKDTRSRWEGWIGRYRLIGQPANLAARLALGVGGLVSRAPKWRRLRGRQCWLRPLLQAGAIVGMRNRTQGWRKPHFCVQVAPK